MLPPVRITGAILQGGLTAIERIALATALSTGYPLPSDKTVTVNTGYNPDTQDAISGLGLPVYGRIVLGHNQEGTANSYVDAQGNSGSYPTIVIDCGLITVDYNQQVIRTYIQGRKGSIKEYISAGDNDITITGIYTAQADVAPYSFIDSLNKLLNAPVSIPIRNTYLNLLGVNYIVLMAGSQLPQTAGGYAIQNFTIKAISDEPATEFLP